MNQSLVHSEPGTPAGLLPSTARGGAVLLSLLVMLSLPVAGSLAHAQSGWTGVVAVIVAASVCCLSAILALVVTERFRGTPNAVPALMGSMLIRTMVPLGIGFAISRSHRELFEVGVFGWVLVYYLGCLAVETLFAVRLLGRGQDVEARA